MTPSMTTQQALDYFDSLEAVELDAMTGLWRGEGINTGHYMDGLLDAARWHGKRFEGRDCVHPLVHTTRSGAQFFVNPTLLPIRLAARIRVPRRVISFGFSVLRPILATRKPKARLRMTQFRGKVSATMIYDTKPINDVFRRIDGKSVLGLMDQRGDDAPFFFKLTKDR